MLFNKDRYTLSDDQIKIVLRNKYKAEKLLGITKTYVFDIVLIKTDEIVGQCDLRLGKSWYLYYLGNIGYSVYIPYRGHHYALKACHLLLELAKKEGETELIITCSPDNIPSFKTILAIPAEYLHTVDVPIEHDLYQRNEKIKSIFRIKL
ncbi:MAG: GNAT family N-acetyltransferase [Erysipelotrichaceae bacterium]|nr:GNAT family N-acetyltransferase [Erysipelotrichaceae bacterium]MDD3924393.1 GNAT family N-acetyltransferase [Erysipelotrichaceae bacterium]MDD4642082.1 GNAT family N-acetyltransferase [Erysipelotrichaceae bacterium]